MIPPYTPVKREIFRSKLLPVTFLLYYITRYGFYQHYLCIFACIFYAPCTIHQGGCLMTLGEILRDLLSENDISQKQLAKHLNMGASTLGNYIQNVREPDYETLKRFADYFHVTTDYLLDHRTDQAISHQEDEVLRIFRVLTKDQQELFIAQGKLFIAQNKKKEKLSESKHISNSVG